MPRPRGPRRFAPRCQVLRGRFLAVTLAIEVRGEGRPLVCLPWFGLDRSVTAMALEPAMAGCPDWRRVYVDLPGCGGSPPGPEDSDGVVDVVAELIEQEIRSPRVLLAGCSYGGYIAAALARRMPERIAGLLLVCSGIKIRKEDRDLPDDAGVAQPDNWLAAVPAGLREHLSLALGNRTPEIAQRVAAVLAASRRGDEDYLQRLRADGYQVSDEGSDAVFAGPTLVVAGRQDRIAGYADQFRALVSYPQATFAERPRPPVDLVLHDQTLSRLDAQARPRRQLPLRHPSPVPARAQKGAERVVRRRTRRGQRLLRYLPAILVGCGRPPLRRWPCAHSLDPAAQLLSLMS